MPRATIASRSSSSTSSVVVLVGDLPGALGEEARGGHVGRAGSGGRGRRWRRRRRHARARPRRRPPSSPAISSDSTPPSPSSPRLRLEAVERVELQQRALHERGGHALAGRRGPGERHGAELLRAPRRRGGGHARLLGAELVALAEPRDQDAALAAARGVLVRDGDLLQPALRLAQLHQPLKRGVGERSPLEHADDARVGSGFLGRAGARADGDGAMSGASLASFAACSPASRNPRPSSGTCRADRSAPIARFSLPGSPTRWIACRNDCAGSMCL